MALGLSDIAQAVVLNTKYDNAGTKALHADMDATADKGSKVGSALGAIGKGLAVAGAVGGAGLVAGFGASIKVAADFEKSLQGVKAATYDNAKSADENARSYEALRKEALQVGKDTSLSASESLRAFGELAKAGVDISDITAGAGRSVVELAESQGTAVDQMAVLASDARNVFKDTLASQGSVADQFKFVANELAKTASGTSTDVGQIQQALAAVGPVASQARLSIHDFDLAVGLMAQQGLKGADAGTSLKTMLLALTAPSSTQAAAFEEIGVSVFDAAGKTRNFKDILGDLHERTKGMSDDEKDGLYRAAFGQDAIRAANILVGEGAAGWEKLEAKIAKAPSISEQAKLRLEGLSGTIEKLKGSAETLAINLGTVLLPGLTSIAHGAESVLNALIEGDWKGAGAVILSGLRDALRTANSFGADVAAWLGRSFAAIDWKQVWSIAQSSVQGLGGLILDGLAATVSLGVGLTVWMGHELAAIDWGAAWKGVENLGDQIAAGLKGVLSGNDAVSRTLSEWIGGQVPKAAAAPGSGGGNNNLVQGLVGASAIAGIAGTVAKLGAGVIGGGGAASGAAAGGEAAAAAGGGIGLGTAAAILIPVALVAVGGYLFWKHLQDDAKQGGTDAGTSWGNSWQAVVKGVLDNTVPPEWAQQQAAILVGAVQHAAQTAAPGLVPFPQPTSYGGVPADITGGATPPGTFSPGTFSPGFFDRVSAAAQGAEKSLHSFLLEAGNFVGGTAAAGEFGKALDLIETSTSRLGDAIGPPLQSALSAAKGALSDVGQAAGRIAGPLGTLANDVLPPVEAGMGLLARGAGLLAAGLGVTLLTAFGGLIELGTIVLPPVFDLIKNMFNTAGIVISGFLQTVKGMVELVDGLLTLNWGRTWQGAKDIVLGFGAVVVGALSVIPGALGPVLELIGNVLSAAWVPIKAGAELAWNGINAAIINPLQGAWDWITGNWGAISDAVTKPFSVVAGLLGAAGPGIASSGLLGGIFESITGTFQGAWDWIDKHFGAVKDAVMAPFEWIRDHGASVFGAVGSAILSPFKDVLRGLDVFLGGISDAVSWVTDHLHLPTLIPKGWSLPQLAAGTDNWPGGLAWVGERGAEIAYLPPGAAVMPHEESVAYAKEHGLPLPGFQFGLGDVLDKLGDLKDEALSFAKEWIGKGAEALLNAALSQFHVSLDLPGAFKDAGTAIFGQIKDGLLAGIKELLGLVSKHVPASFQGIAVNLPGSVTDWVHAGAQLGLGRDLTADELGAILYLISRESGGDPNAYNPVDVGNGEHAQGILQTIGSTFAAYAVPGHGNILNPVDNIAAALRYILAAYHGDLTAPARAEAGGAAGYGTGGIAGLHGAELAWLGEFGPELVLPLKGFADGLNTGFGTEAQALGYYLAQQVTLLTSLQTLGLAANANALALLDAVRGQGVASASQSSAQVKSTDATTAAVTATGAETAAAVEKVVTPGGLTNTPELTEYRKALSELVPLIAGGGGLAPAVKAATNAATAAAGGLGGLTEADEYAALGSRFLGDDLREAVGPVRDAASITAHLADTIRDTRGSTADMGSELVKAGKAVSGLADSAKGAAQQLDAVGTPGTAPNPYAPSTEPPKAPTASSYFGDYVLGVTSDGRQVALYVKQSVAGQGSSIPTGRYAVRGFALGGIITEPVAGIGLLSGRMYSIAESGPEWVRPLTADNVVPGERDGGFTVQGDVHLTIPVNSHRLSEVDDLIDMIEEVPQRVRAMTGQR